MACVCSRYNERSDWPIVGHSPVISTVQLLRPFLSDLAIAQSIKQGITLRFSVKSSLLVNK